MPQTILFCGTYDPKTPRARQYLRLANLSGAEIETHNAALWGDKRDSSFGAAWLLKLPKLLFAYLGILKRLLVGSKVDAVVFLYPGYLDAILLSWAAKRCGRKVVLDQFISIHDTVVTDRKLVSEKNPLAWFLKLIDKAACRAVDMVVFDTPQHFDLAVERYGLKPANGMVLWVGADQSVFSRKGSSQVDSAVLFYGTFIPLHGTDTIVQAAKLLPDTLFRIIGKGQESERISTLVKQLGVTNITMVDPMPEEDLVSEVQRSTICLGIFGTTEKAQRVVPNKVFQCAAMGKAVITEASPAMTAAFGDSITTVAPGEPKQLADAISAIIEGNQTGALGTAAAKEFDERFSDAALLDDFRSIIAI